MLSQEMGGVMFEKMVWCLIDLHYCVSAKQAVCTWMVVVKLACSFWRK
jgi:hypothetical protein